MEKAILATHIGELGWEILRFAPHVIYHKFNNPHYKLIVHVRPDRFDLYGKHAHIFEPLIIEGDGDKYKGNCFTLTKFPMKKYNEIIGQLEKKYSKRFQIVNHIFPNINQKSFAKKDQLHHNQMDYSFEPRDENFELVDKWLISEKPIVSLAPRFRKKFPRNWSHWGTLYDMISKDNYLKRFTFVICGKDPEYIPDSKNRFYDVNLITQTNGTSLIGITIAVLKKSILTVGSQSGIPNLSNLVGTPTLQWGHQQWFHEKTYNVKNTPTKFLVTGTHKSDYDSLTPDVVFREMKNFLRERST